MSLLLRELRLGLRTGGGALLALSFFLITIALAPFAIGPERDLLQPIAPGLLWLGALLAMLLSLDRLFARDQEDGTLDLLAMSQPLWQIAAVKALAHWLLTGVPLTILSPVLALMLNLSAAAIPTLMASLFIGTAALSLIGTIGAALTMGLTRGGLLLAVTMLPATLPTLILGAKAAQLASTGGDPLPALALLSGLTLLLALAAPPVAAFCLRLHLNAGN
ncbi:heme exporter protein CcmB [Paracoccaceae bacterium GXU_MW_L88]